MARGPGAAAPLALALGLLWALARPRGCGATGCFETNATAQVLCQEGAVRLALWPALPQAAECSSFPTAFQARLSMGGLQLRQAVTGFRASQASSIRFSCAGATALGDGAAVDLESCKVQLRDATSGKYELDGTGQGNPLVFEDPVQAVELRNFDYTECWQDPTFVFSLVEGQEFVGIRVTPTNCELPTTAFANMIVRLIYVSTLQDRAILGPSGISKIITLGSYSATNPATQFTTNAAYNYGSVTMFGLDASVNPGAATLIRDFLQPFLICHKGSFSLTFVSHFCEGEGCNPPPDSDQEPFALTMFFATTVAQAYDTQDYSNCFEGGWLAISPTRLSIHYSVTNGVRCFEPLTAAEHEFTLVVSYGYDDEQAVAFSRHVGEFDFRSGATTIYPNDALDDTRLLRLYEALQTGKVVLRSRLYCAIKNKYGSYLNDVAINLPTVRMDRYKRIDYAVGTSSLTVRPVAYVSSVAGDSTGPRALQVILYENEGTDDISLDITELGRFSQTVQATPTSSFTLGCSLFQAAAGQTASCSETLAKVRTLTKTRHAIARLVVAADNVDVLEDSVYSDVSTPALVVLGVCAAVVLVGGLTYLFLELRKNRGLSAYGGSGADAGAGEYEGERGAPDGAYAEGYGGAYDGAYGGAYGGARGGSGGARGEPWEPQGAGGF